MNDKEVSQAIEAALKMFPSQPLAEAASHLLDVLGYTSKKNSITEGSKLIVTQGINPSIGAVLSLAGGSLTRKNDNFREVVQAGFTRKLK